MTPMIAGLSTKKADPSAPARTLEEDIANKMSASDASSKIDLLAPPGVISKIISKAYCLDGDAEDNSVLKLIKNLVFKLTNEFLVMKWDDETKAVVPNKVYTDYDELHKDVALGSTNGGIHPADLKCSLAKFFIDFLEPIRADFDNDEGRELLKNAYGQ